MLTTYHKISFGNTSNLNNKFYNIVYKYLEFYAYNFHVFRFKFRNLTLEESWIHLTFMEAKYESFQESSISIKKSIFRI